MKRRSILVLVLCLLLTGCGQTKQEMPPEEPPKQEVQPSRAETKEETTPETLEMPEETLEEGEPNLPNPLADAERTIRPLVGDATSPNGKWEVRLTGVSKSVDSDGLYAPQFVDLVDTTTGDVLWRDIGAFEQSVTWSPKSDFLMLARTNRTYCTVTAVDTTEGFDWEFELPDGSAIPEYTYLPEEWVHWLDDNSLDLTIGKGGDAGEQHTYRCSLFPRENELEGHVLEETTVLLESDYDFNRDGVAEMLELVTVWSPELTDTAVWYELQVCQGDEILWLEEAAPAHVGWNSLFALRMDGEDFLLRYNPYMNQGAAAYQLELFTLNEVGVEVVHEERVEFDINFGSPVHQSFDAAAIADFLWAAKTLINGSHLLLSTEGGTLVADVTGIKFDAPIFGEEFEAARNPSELENLLRQLDGERTDESVASIQEEIANDFNANHNGIPEKLFS